ncbi:MAG: PKD domain-containing protein [Candidatus Krumholzibacteriota bacterium]
MSLSILMLGTAVMAADITYQNSAGAVVQGVRCSTPVPTADDIERNAQAVDAWLKASGFMRDKAGVVIPVAIHVVAHDDGYADVPDSYIYDQMDVLNAAYQGTGFSFSLASIDRTYNTRWSTHRYGSNQMVQMKQALAIDPATTYNLYFCDIGGGLLGYATFPDMYPEDSYLHGVVCLWGSVPGGWADPYNEGDTATHETGHFLGLYHTFQDGCTEPNDYCDDTPQESSPAYGCPEGRDSCSAPGIDPITNFMDYTDDYCMYEFTADQTTRMNQQMALYRPTMYGGTTPTGPTAAFSGTPTSGDYPLTVAFSDESTGGPTSWDWTFGDGGTSTAQNPSYTYTAAGSYNVSLTVANGDGSDTLTRNGYITVTEPGSGGSTMYVSDIAVSRKVAGPNNTGLCSVTIVDDGGAPAAGATVTVSYDGPNSGTLSSLTGSTGVASFSTPKLKNPSGEWCFEVTDVTHASLTYDPASNVTTRSCESGDVYRRGLPATGAVQLANHPNPFNPTTVFQFVLPHEGYTALRVYDARGRLVDTPVDGVLGEGMHAVTWDARGRSSGIYFYQLQTGNLVETRKMMLLK